ncbi:hypothetical protein BH23CYA1_BH23CYA1_13660 [soil metagenome]
MPTSLRYPHIANPEGYTFVMGEDYEVTRSNSACHWHGLGLYLDYRSSGAGWGNPAQAQADAFYCLHRADGLIHEEAMAGLVNLRYFGDAILMVVSTEHA